MKNVTLLTLAASVILGISATAFSYEGGTKRVVRMALPQRGPADVSAIPAVLSYELTGSKPVVNFLRRIPEPTLSVERIREEKPGASLGTKAVVLFQKER